MKYKVLFSPTTDIEGFEQIRDYIDSDIDVEFCEEVPSKADYQVLVSFSPSQNHLTASPNLRKLIYPSAGPSLNVIRLVSELPHVSLYQLPYNSVAVAETALALLLAAAKFIRKADADLRRGDWSHRQSEQPQLLLHRRTALILGCGRVGSYLASILQALQMDVHVIRQHLDKDGASDADLVVHGRNELADLLPLTDVLINTLPNTPEAADWIGAAELGLMPAHAIIVNVGNGQTFDEAALFAALRSNHIAGAGIDVWYNSPTNETEHLSTSPSRFPFGTLDNVVLSPHRAGAVSPQDDERVEMLADMINKDYRGEEVPYRVHLGLGY